MLVLTVNAVFIFDVVFIPIKPDEFIVNALLELSGVFPEVEQVNENWLLLLSEKIPKRCDVPCSIKSI